MRQINKILSKLDGYLISIRRNTLNGNYELEVGFPKNWAYKSTDSVECEVIHETDEGCLLKIKPLNEEILIDDLIDFVNIIINTNQEIVKLEKEFEEQLEKAKLDLEDKVKNFYEKIEEKKKTSFNEISMKNENLITKKNEEDTLKKEVEDKISK